MLNYQRVNNGTWLYLSQSKVKIRWDVCYRSDLCATAWPAAFFATCDPKNQLKISRKPFQVGGGWERPVQPCSNVLLCFLMLLLAYKTVYFWYFWQSHCCKVHPHSHELVYKLPRLYIYLPKTVVSPLSPIITHVPFVESPFLWVISPLCQGYKSLEGTVTSVECGRPVHWLSQGWWSHHMLGEQMANIMGILAFIYYMY